MNRKSITVLFLIAALFMFSAALYADTSGNHGESIDAILSGIRSELNLGNKGVIAPDKVSDSSLEKLGEAVMSFRIPDPRQHEFMDKMMGGEGSESLANMHKLLGYRYLENGSTDFGSMMGGVSGYGGENMFGRGFGGSEMEGSFGGRMPGIMAWNSGYGWIIPLFFAVFIIIIAFLIILLVRRGKVTDNYSMKPLIGLKERYAKGDIGRDEYLAMKRDILDK